MKKLFLLLFMLGVIVNPINTYATVDFTGYYCDSKKPLGDGTFYMTCHIAVDSTEDVKQVKGDLILTNVTLESIKTYDDWESLNGLSSHVEFVSSNGHIGTYTVAELLFTGDLSDEECEASFVPVYEETVDRVCMIIDGTYYGENGTIVSEEKYYEECCDYVCTIVDDQYYFDSKGNSVTYEKMIEDCGDTVVSEEFVENPQTGINYGYIILPIGIISIIVILKIAKKNTKIYKI